VTVNAISQNKVR